MLMSYAAESILNDDDFQSEIATPPPNPLAEARATLGDDWTSESLNARILQLDNAIRYATTLEERHIAIDQRNDYLLLLANGKL
jgi:hypothetical protein